MIDRRRALAGIVLGAITASTPNRASACEYTEWEDDHWGEKLIAYLRSGNEALLKDLFLPECTLVCFEKRYILDDTSLVFEGADQVRKAIVGLRASLLKPRGEVPGATRYIERTSLDGPLYDGQMNRITLVASNGKPADTSCGWTTFEEARHIYYQAGIQPGIEHMAILPPMYERNIRG
jgi:hypothetical protein